jgi:hypothetical protein
VEEAQRIYLAIAVFGSEAVFVKADVDEEEIEGGNLFRPQQVHVMKPMGHTIGWLATFSRGNRNNLYQVGYQSGCSFVIDR